MSHVPLVSIVEPECAVAADAAEDAIVDPECAVAADAAEVAEDPIEAEGAVVVDAGDADAAECADAIFTIILLVKCPMSFW